MTFPDRDEGAPDPSLWGPGIGDSLPSTNPTVGVVFLGAERNAVERSAVIFLTSASAAISPASTPSADTFVSVRAQRHAGCPPSQPGSTNYFPYFLTAASIPGPAAPRSWSVIAGRSEILAPNARNHGSPIPGISDASFMSNTTEAVL